MNAQKGTHWILSCLRHGKPNAQEEQVLGKQTDTKCQSNGAVKGCHINDD
jgi:hypothetical protein